MDIVTKKPISGDTTVTVHPLVLLSVVDHYNRACKGTKNRAVGVLLGSWKSPTNLDIANSFAGRERNLGVWNGIAVLLCTLTFQTCRSVFT